MIAVDSSAVIAILYSEQSAPKLRHRLVEARRALISAATVLEIHHVLLGSGSKMPWARVESLFGEYFISIRPFDERQLALARDAAARFGKGRHKARLNYGDCFAYALAKSEDVPLLCVGNDFALTDLAIA